MDSLKPKKRKRPQLTSPSFKTLEDDNCDDKLPSNKRFAWSPGVNDAFMMAVFDIGLQMATEENILEEMGLDVWDNIDFSPKYIVAAIQKFRTFRYFDMVQKVGNGGAEIQELCTIMPSGSEHLPERNGQLDTQYLLGAALQSNGSRIIPLNSTHYSSGDCDSYGEYMGISPGKYEAPPFNMNNGALDLNVISGGIAELAKSIEKKLGTVSQLLVSLSDASRGLQRTLETDGKCFSSVIRTRNARLESPTAAAANNIEVLTSLKQGPQEDITKSHFAGEGRRISTEEHPLPSNPPAAIPTGDVLKLRQEMMSHISTHRQMWSKPGQLNPSATNGLSYNWPDCPMVMPPVPVQSNGVPTFHNIANNNQRWGELDSLIDWNVDEAELDDTLFNFLSA